MGPIGVFDSGYGGLTILKEIRKALPQYDYIYLGDNARAPYGTRGRLMWCTNLRSRLSKSFLPADASS